MNTFVKIMAYTWLHLSTAVQMFIMGLIITAPVMCLVYSVLDRLCMGYLLSGKFGIVWFTASFVIFLPLFIRVEVHAHKARRR